MFGVVSGNLQPNTTTESALMSSVVMNRMLGFVFAPCAVWNDKRQNKTNTKKRFLVCGFMTLLVRTTVTGKGFQFFATEC
jgi:hypothetical protein